MATVTLYDPEDLEYELPRVCMVCGKEATTYKRKRFSWNPGWVYVLILLGLLPFLIVALITTRRMVVEVPLCRRHRHHWLGRQLLILGSLLGLLLVVFVTPALFPPRAVGEWYFLLIPFGLLAWLILVVIVNQGMIRPREITEDSIGLQGVSKAFKEALTEWRREADEQEWEERERRDAPRRPITAEDRERYPDAFEEDRPRRPRDQYRTGEP